MALHYDAILSGDSHGQKLALKDYGGDALQPDIEMDSAPCQDAVPAVADEVSGAFAERQLPLTDVVPQDNDMFNDLFEIGGYGAAGDPGDVSPAGTSSKSSSDAGDHPVPPHAIVLGDLPDADRPADKDVDAPESSGGDSKKSMSDSEPGEDIAIAVATRGSTHPMTDKWGRLGQFVLRYRPPGGACDNARWIATCPFHRKNTSTGCQKSYTIANDAHGEVCQISLKECALKVKHWCNAAGRYDRQRYHIAYHPSICDVPEPALVFANQMTEPMPSQPVLVDDELDMIELALDAPVPDAPSPEGPASSRRRGRGRGRGHLGGVLCHTSVDALQITIPNMGSLAVSCYLVFHMNR